MNNKKKEMTPEAFDLIAGRFRALAEPLRLRILHTLGQGEMSVNEIVVATGAGQANVSKHLGLLLDAGIVGRRKEGLNAFYRVTDDSIFEMCDLVCGSLAERLAAQHSVVKTFARR